MQHRVLAAAALLALLAVSSLVHVVRAGFPYPDILLKEPDLADYEGYAAPNKGRIPNAEALAAKPRAVVGFLSEADWALVEFVTMMHASWRYVTLYGTPEKLKMDLIVFADVRWAREVAKLCTPIDLHQLKAAGQGFGSIFSASGDSQCFVVLYPPPPKEHWHGYPFINNVHMLADPAVAEFLTTHYGYVMKTDFDTFLTAALLRHFPPRLEVGAMEYVLLPQTAQRLARIAQDLQLRYDDAGDDDDDAIAAADRSSSSSSDEADADERDEVHRGSGDGGSSSSSGGTEPAAAAEGSASTAAKAYRGRSPYRRPRHNVGPTWYGDAAQIVALANLSIPVMHHIYAREFPHVPASAGGGLAQNWRGGEGWPLWNGGAIAMYATELAANHLFDEFDITDKYDHHGDSPRYTFTVYHIHCRHGDGHFSKFEFLKHHYDGVDVSASDFHQVKNYALSLAVTTWRQLSPANRLQQQQVGAGASGSAAAAAAVGAEAGLAGGGGGQSGARTEL